MVMQEGRVSVSEREADAPLTVPSSATSIAVVGTGAGLKAGVLEDNTPVLYNSATAALDALRPDSGIPPGTLWAGLRGVQNNAPNRVIVVQAQSDSATDVDAATDTLADPTGGVLADLVVAHGVNGSTSAADDVVAHLEALCESIDASFIVCAPIVGSDNAAQIAAAKTYAENNDRARGIILFSRGLLSNAAVDISAHYAGALARHDAEVHRGANPRGLTIRGIAGTTPRLNYNFQGRGNQADDVSNLLESNIVPIIERVGVQAWGTRYSGFALSDPSPFKYIQIRRTADQIVEHAQVIAQPFATENVDPAAPQLVASRLARYMDGLRAIGQIRGFDALPDPARNTQAALDAGNIFLLIRFSGTVPTNHIAIVVEATTGTIVA